MTPRVEFSASISEDGRITPEGVGALRARLKRWAGKRVLVRIEPWRKPRTLTANAYLWGVVYAVIADWSGHDPEEIHEAMKKLILPPRTVSLGPDQVTTIAGSTAHLDTAEFSEYVGRVKRWAAEQGLYVPEPGEAT